jgi:hypothetical protein
MSSAGLFDKRDDGLLDCSAPAFVLAIAQDAGRHKRHAIAEEKTARALAYYLCERP